MFTREETIVIIQRIFESRPTKLFKPLDETRAGLHCVLRMLDREEKPLTAGQISTKMGVSSARVAVLLRKMAEKGLIVREGSPDDARKSMISLSDKGRSQIEKLNEERINVFQGVINRLGKEKTEQFIQLSGELKKAFEDEIAEREASGKGGDL